MKHPEDAIQAAVVAHLVARGVPGLVFWHTPNSSRLGGKRTKDGVPFEAIRLKLLGLRKGVADLILVHNGRCFALELKSEKGRPTEPQMAFISDFNAAGGNGCIVHGLDKALKVLEVWGLLRGKS
jgi:hypothetical protein